MGFTEDGTPYRGNPNAAITLVESSDFQCPFCGRAMATMMKLLKAYPKDVRLVFKHHPLSFHRQAHIAAQAAVEAYKQKKFWKYQNMAHFASTPPYSPNTEALHRSSMRL